MSQLRQLQSFNVTTVTAHMWINGIMKYLHGIFFFAVVCFLYGLGIPLLTPYLSYPQDYGIQIHMRVGVSLLVFTAIQLVGGTVLFILRRAIPHNSLALYNVRRVHMCVGYFVLYYAKASGLYMYYGGGLFYLILFIEAVFLNVLGYIKVFRRKMQECSEIFGSKHFTKQLRSLLEIEDNYRDYGLVGNYVYDLTPLKIQHPGGYEVVKSVREKDLDRYLFGMYRSEGLPMVPPNSHTVDAMKMLRMPIGKLEIESPYEEYNESGEMEFKLQTFRKVSSGDIYELSFVPRHFNSMQFKGYSEVSQLGRYRAVGVNGVTRLYTAVNFLNQKNKKIMKEIFPGWFEESQCREQKLSMEMECKKHKKEEYLPIMLKRYNNGKLTPVLLNLKADDKIVISGYRGPGLRLGDIKPGKIILVGGGTGCFPYYDLIDLLFKANLVATNHVKKNEILQLNPILRSYLFDRHQFVLLWAFQSQNDIHTIILQQLIHLSLKANNFRCILKIKAKPIVKKGNIRYESKNFQQLITMQMSTQFSKLMICGPPPMNEGLFKVLSHIPAIQDKWFIL